MSLPRRTRIRSRSAKRVRAYADPQRDLIRQAVFERDEFCRLAGSTLGPCYGDRMTFHHLLKDGQGGEWSMRNGLTLCAHHNDTVETMPRADAEAWGLVVAYGMTHEEAWRRLAFAGIIERWWDGTPVTRPQPEALDIYVRGHG